MPVRLRDVAEKLNLSTGLVSGVLNDRPGVWASEITRRRIRDTASEMGYQPNAAARSLGSGRANALAFVFQNQGEGMGRNNYSQVMGEVARYLNQQGCELLIRIADDQQGVLTNLRLLAETRACDAFLLWGAETEVEAQAILLESLGKPFVAKGRHEVKHPTWPQIDYDHEAMMAQVVEHLAARGHERIAYVGFESDQPFRFRHREGFQAAMQQRFGHPAPPELVFEGYADREVVRRQMHRWLEMPLHQQPTALANAASNDAWVGVEIALAERGCRIDNDGGAFAVAGNTMSDITLLFGQAYAFPHVDFAELAAAAVESLFPGVLRGEPIAQPVVRVTPALQPLGSLHLFDSLGHAVIRQRSTPTPLEA